MDILPQRVMQTFGIMGREIAVPPQRRMVKGRETATSPALEDDASRQNGHYVTPETSYRFDMGFIVEQEAPRHS